MAQNAASNGFIAEFAIDLTATTTIDQTEAIVLGVESTDDGPVIVAPGLDENAVSGLQDQLEALGVKGKADEVTRVAGSTTGFDTKIVVLTGLGSADAPAQGTPMLDNSPAGEISAEALRRAAGAATAKLAGTTEITIALPADSAARLTAIAEGAALGTYSFDGYKTKQDNGDEEQTNGVDLKIVTELAEADTLLVRASAVARATFITRDLVNTAPSHLFPAHLLKKSKR